MDQEHAAGGECPKAELIMLENFTRTTDASSGVPQTELSGDNQNVVALLLMSELLEAFHSLDTLSEMRRTELPLTIIGKITLARERLEHLFDSRTVGRCEHFVPRNGEPSLGTERKSLLRDASIECRLSDLRKDLLQNSYLMFDGLDFVPFRVAKVGADFLVEVLLMSSQPCES
ncbi:hypothetical protein COX00_02500 [Candidatus Uhrbacteria bacterium CG22_combo_CG10-13_8_21_14_all_47_17]|uniref:Uncharacterized protein n=1 Tax=Candidatus Uhrbacteria bacterium CG22_combo_CG10-13_8_21_14_all_47_17 TaxID=1975041 RepID=A0A2H0BSH9_9BACT|nr:MAG: hypothetical protein COX00_02500 [Candidatus Uhrbacteria bacterium CG22_combo_CG10-13_8_21_14_all_47_17]